MSELSIHLKETRLAQGLTLEEVAQRTYIKLPYLQALEEGRLDQLPAPVYIYGYIRQVAKLLGLDGSALVAQFQLQERTGGPGALPSPPAQRSHAPMADLPGDPFNSFKAAFSPNGNGHGKTSHGTNGKATQGNGMPPAANEYDGADARAAKAQAQQILVAAERDAEQLVRGAERYADDVLATLEREIAQTLQTIQNGRQFLATRRAPGSFGPLA